MDKELRVLLHKRETIKTKLIQFKNYLNNNKSEDIIPQLKLRTSVIEKILPEFEDIQTEIELKDNDGNQLMERSSFEDTYFEIVSEAQEFIRKHSAEQASVHLRINESSSSHGNNQYPETQVRLPIINLPIFSGSFDEWNSFKESFQALVDGNQTLPDIQKFYYLKSSLKGEAANVIHSLEASSANYTVAWDLLKDRFENTRLIVNKYVSSLFNLPKLMKEESHNIRVLLDDINKNLRALEALGQPTEHWGTLLVYIISSKLPLVTLQDWEKSCEPKTLPKLDEILSFLGNRCQVLETIENQTKINSNFRIEKVNSNNQMKSSNSFKPNSLKSSCLTTESSHDMCRVCNKDHKIFQCETFLSLEVSDRISKVKSLALCYNCLKSGGHRANECKSRGCKLCGKKHNTLLHISSSANNKPALSQSRSNGSPQDEHLCTNDSGKQTNSKQIDTHSNEKEIPMVSSVGVSSSHNITSLNHVLLPTAVVNVEDVQGNLYPCRVLLDSASQCNFITEHMTQILRLKKERVLSSITGVSQTTTHSRKLVNATLRSRFTSYCTNLDFIVLPRITIDLPSVPVVINNLNIPVDLELADPNWHKPSRIDMLIGAEVFMELLNADQSSVENIHPNITNTKLGAVVSGKSQTVNRAFSNNSYSSNFVSTKTVESQLQRFWALDEVSAQLSAEDAACEKHFNETTKRDSTGRYIVSMPLKHGLETLGDSYKIAKTRLEHMERKFSKNPDLHKDYAAFIKEYQDLGHMEPVSSTDCSDLTTYYLPHHAVVKETSSTTKLRVVFDGSAKPSNGVSLNEALLVGPCIQQDLFSIVSRFRTYNYAINSDIEKMYRQINIEETQQNLLRILWRENPFEPMLIFKLKTVTYGTSCAPYLSTRTLLQLAKDEGHLFPQAAEVLKRDFYIDDLLTGSNTIEGAKQLQGELSSLLKKGGFHLRKWISNCNDILLQIPEKDREFKGDISSEHSTKTLGLLWNASTDHFHYSVNYNTEQPNYSTKRTVLSELSQVFDPLGLIEPVIIQLKIFVQNLWKLEIGWDNRLPDSHQELWMQYKSNLVYLDSIQIPRRVLPADSSREVEIHAFCDASMTAYGACIYFRQTDAEGKIHSRLLCSKSRVAPINKISLPRLELCAALLLSRLISKVLATINLPYNSCTLWSDSTIVLAWLNSSSSRWKTFVANRVSEIQSLTKDCTWQHVRTNDNPADIVSRGTTPAVLKDCNLWWHGPPWLSLPNTAWPQVQEQELKDDSYNKEARKLSVTSAPVMISETIVDNLINKYSSFSKLQSVLAYCLRFVHNAKTRTSEGRTVGPLSPQELQSAHTVLIKTIQSQAFSDELLKLKANKPVSKKSKIRNLRPFLGENDIIRVGGRLEQSSIDYDHKHSIVLPNCKFTKLLVRYFHKMHLHAGPQQLLAVVRQKYWPINARSLVKKVCKECITCFRVSPKLSQQLMGSLPKERVEPNRPFINTGVDYCGPVFIKTKSGRGGTSIKTYVAIFICLSVKAVHIELVQDLSSEAFIAALKRFMARRGKVSKIFSDNGSNFVGANRELRELKQLFEKESHMKMLTEELASQNIEWKFIPPNAPHFGGLWEAAVKSTKYHLKRVTNNNLLTYDEMNTLLTQIEACLNSRPLLPISDDPSDLTYLTPGHFIIGEALTTNLEPDLQHIKMNRLSRWQRVQQMFQHFWKRWSAEYLIHLQSRGKWLKETDNIKKDELVIIQDKNLPPLKWKTGRVTNVHPGPDGKVRVVTVKTADNIIKRAVTSLCQFPKIEDE